MESEGIGSTAETTPDNAVDSAFEENETVYLFLFIFYVYIRTYIHIFAR